MLEYEQLAAENVVADFWELYSVEFVVRNFAAAAAAAAAAEVDCAVVAAAVMKLRSVDVESQVQIVVVLVVELVASVVA
jgi:predicted lysophospholipase L1 biosynthesis ABC-type transport system permease subunit